MFIAVYSAGAIVEGKGFGTDSDVSERVAELKHLVFCNLESLLQASAGNTNR
jgi:hypothetical protein